MKSILLALSGCFLLFGQFSSAHSDVLAQIQTQVDANSSTVHNPGVTLQAPLTLSAVKFDDDPSKPLLSYLIDLKPLAAEELTQSGFSREMVPDSQYFALLVGFPFLESRDDISPDNGVRLLRLDARSGRVYWLGESAEFEVLDVELIKTAPLGTFGVGSWGMGSGIKNVRQVMAAWASSNHSVVPSYLSHSPFSKVDKIEKVVKGEDCEVELAPKTGWKSLWKRLTNGG